MERERTIRADVRFRCPFCGVEAAAGYSDRGRPVVVHQLPICDKFDELGPVEFLTAARARRGN